MNHFIIDVQGIAALICIIRGPERHAFSDEYATGIRELKRSRVVCHADGILRWNSTIPQPNIVVGSTTASGARNAVLHPVIWQCI